MVLSEALPVCCRDRREGRAKLSTGLPKQRGRQEEELLHTASRFDSCDNEPEIRKHPPRQEAC